MERRGCRLGCIIAVLGLALSCCLLPYLVSSIFSIANTVLDESVPPTWLWGDVINQAVDADSPLYMVLTEGPICCVGTLALLLVILGLVIVISSVGQGGEPYAEEAYAPHEEPARHDLDLDAQA